MIVLEIIGIILLWFFLGFLSAEIFNLVFIDELDVGWFSLVLCFGAVTFIVAIVCLIFKLLYNIYSGESK